MGCGATLLGGPASDSRSPAVESTVGEEMGIAAGSMIGDYVVTGELGRGGMGIVYAAQHPAIGKEVAIKVVHRSLSGDASVKQRVLQEARILSEVRNAHIVDIYSFGELDDGRYYLVMELVEGESLAEHVCSRSVPCLEAVEILLQIADALTVCHTSGVVHRDLKPENIFLRRQGDAVAATLLDFGIAKVEGLNVKDGLTAQGIILGTPDYMSPEQARAEEIDERSDLFSLGILAFEIITGQLPFKGETVIETLHAILRETPPSACELRADVPVELGELVAELMEKNPDDRPSSQEVCVRLNSIRCLLAPQSFAPQRLPSEAEHRLTTDGEHSTSGAAFTSQEIQLPTPPLHAFASLKPFLIVAAAGAALLLAWMMATGGDVQVADATIPVAPPAPALSVAESAPGADSQPNTVVSGDVASEHAAAAIPEPQKKSVGTLARPQRVEGATENLRRSQRASPEPATQPSRKRLAPDGLLDPFGKKRR